MEILIKEAWMLKAEEGMGWEKGKREKWMHIKVGHRKEKGKKRGSAWGVYGGQRKFNMNLSLTCKDYWGP